MEGTVTISIREYERLKDLPRLTIKENKELKYQYDLLLAKQSVVKNNIQHLEGVIQSLENQPKEKKKRFWLF